jgi:glycosyltransferase involved in cell wall biosynthesis
VKLHLVALPHTQVSDKFVGCAYTAKVVKFCRMMKDKYPIILYAPEGPPVDGVTLVPCLTDAERTATFGADDPNRLPAWPTDQQTATFNLNVVKNMIVRLDPDDIIMLVAGYTHFAVAQAFPNHAICEPFVGYEGIIGGRSWAAYESYAHMHNVYALKGIRDIRWFDTVIPPYYDPKEFPKCNNGSGDYLLFLGRLIFRKGVHIAAQIADACNMPLVIAGSGATEISANKIVAPEVVIEGKDLKYVGPVDVKQRAKLIAGARAMLVPTTYMEPGGNVAIEAMAAGTPAITTDFGVFTETVPSKFRFRTLRDAVAAVERAMKVDNSAIQNYALANFSLRATAPKFQKWFDDLLTLRDKGWYSLC